VAFNVDDLLERQEKGNPQGLWQSRLEGERRSCSKREPPIDLAETDVERILPFRERVQLLAAD
jgi:hypothetical protein